MNSVPVMPSELLSEGAAVGSPLGTEASVNYSPLDQGSEEAEAAATDPVPAPHEVDMPEVPADGEERPATPADADDAPPPPPQSAAEEADPVPHPQEEEMPVVPADAEALADAEAPADAEERPAAPPPHRVRQRRTSSLLTRSPSQSASCRRLGSRWTPRCPTWGTSSSCKRGCLRVCF